MFLETNLTEGTFIESNNEFKWALNSPSKFTNLINQIMNGYVEKDYNEVEKIFKKKNMFKLPIYNFWVNLPLRIQNIVRKIVGSR